MENLLKELNFQNGLMPSVIVDAEDGQVLTLCYLSEEALRKTLETGIVHLFRRSKGRLMMKGETSGHTQHLKELRVDCGGKSLVLEVKQKVAACHMGYKSCYYRRYDISEDRLLIDGEKIFDPEDVYG
ncbi:MAG: phosphoribosyl-AMP cyclohydrolase [Candidatus Brocadiia bacterium]